MAEFDLNVHTRSKDGKILNINNYKYVCNRDTGNYFVRDGIKFYPNGEVMQDKETQAAPVSTAEKPKKLG